MNMTKTPEEVMKQLKTDTGLRTACLHFAEDLINAIGPVLNGKATGLYEADAQRVAVHNFSEPLTPEMMTGLMLYLALNGVVRSNSFIFHLGGYICSLKDGS